MEVFHLIWHPKIIGAIPFFQQENATLIKRSLSFIIIHFITNIMVFAYMYGCMHMFLHLALKVLLLQAIYYIKCMYTSLISQSVNVWGGALLPGSDAK